MADLDRLRQIAACEFTFTDLSLLLADQPSQEASEEINAYYTRCCGVADAVGQATLAKEVLLGPLIY